MFRRLTLTTLLLAAACGDSSNDTTTTDAAANTDASGGGGGQTDAGSGGETDTGTASTATPDQVTNVGTTCSSANDCEGESPTCQTMLSLLGQQVPFGGGYCTATCTEDIECGEGGECPVGAVLKMLGPAASLVSAFAPSNCYLRCTSDDDCRTDEEYRCATISDALSQGAGQNAQAGLINMLLSGPIVNNKYCLPPAPVLPDAGTTETDAGGTTDAGTTDAGTTDAGTTDAGTTDAASGDAS